jgi:hypothetical protein
MFELPLASLVDRSISLLVLIAFLNTLNYKETFLSIFFFFFSEQLNNCSFLLFNSLPFLLGSIIKGPMKPIDRQRKFISETSRAKCDSPEKKDQNPKKIWLRYASRKNIKH